MAGLDYFGVWGEWVVVCYTLMKVPWSNEF